MIYERVNFLHNKTRHNRISEYIIDDESPVLNAHNAWFSHLHRCKSGTQIWSNLVKKRLLTFDYLNIMCFYDHNDKKSIKTKTNITIKLVEIWLKSSINLTKIVLDLFMSWIFFLSFLHIYNIKNVRVRRKVCIGSKNTVHAPVWIFRSLPWFYDRLF